MRPRVCLLTLLLLTAACAPAPPPPPTPTKFVPVQLLTPRPTEPPATATPRPLVTPRPEETRQPTLTATPELRGTPVAAAEPLQGVLRDDGFYSPIIGDSFPYRVYLPPDYQRSQHRYPVLYMLHGNGGNYTEWSDSYLPEQADRLIVAHDIPPMIIVMPEDGGVTYWANWSNDGPRWADYVAEDVVANIDQRYRTLPDAGSRAIGGLSMGGWGALNLALQHPDVFGIAGGHSPSVRLEPDPALWFLIDQNFWDHNPIWLAQHRAGIENLSIWMDAGTEDVWLPNIEAVHVALVARGLNVTWHNFPGPHEAEYWIEHVPDYLRFYGANLRT